MLTCKKGVYIRDNVNKIILTRVNTNGTYYIQNIRFSVP